MAKKSLAVRSHSPQVWKPQKLEIWTKIGQLSNIKLGKGSKAAVYRDKGNVPRLFIFNTSALLDVLSAIDEPLLDKLSDEEYHSPKTNPAGWLIDKIESHLPVSPKFTKSLKDALREADRKGWISFSKICSDLGLA